MFLTIVLSVWTVMHIYVFWRAASVPLIARNIPLRALIPAAGILWVSFFLSRVLEDLNVQALAQALEVFGANWLGMLFLLFVSMLVVDILTGFGFFLPRRAPSLRGWALVAGGVLCVIAFVQGLRPPVVRNYEVQLGGLPAERDGSVLVLVSDFHLGTLLGKDWLEARIAQIEAERPDIVVLGGDIIEGDSPRERELVPVLRRLSAPFGVWVVTGNHEFHAGLDGARMFQDAGFHVLRDRWAEVLPGLVIAGIDYRTSRRAASNPNFIARALVGRPSSAATVLVSHAPLAAEKAVSAGVGLMLCSHTHGGQIWPFGYVVRSIYPFLAGRHDVNGLVVIVSRGTGTWGPRMRLWHPGEIVRITLRAPAGSKP